MHDANVNIFMKFEIFQTFNTYLSPSCPHPTPIYEIYNQYFDNCLINVYSLQNNIKQYCH